VFKLDFYLVLDRERSNDVGQLGLVGVGKSLEGIFSFIKGLSEIRKEAMD
jgi:hypothetical protein